MQLELFEAPMPNEFPKISEKGSDGFVFHFLDILTAPLIVYPGGWSDSLPDHLKKNVALGRMIMAAQRKEEASIPELLAYLYTANFCVPLSESWSQIFFYVAREYMTHFEKVKELPAEIKDVELNDYEIAEMKSLARWIYRKRREALKRKERKGGKIDDNKLGCH